MPGITQSRGHRALRIGRHSQAGHAYLVTVTTWQRQTLFNRFDLARTACRAFTRSGAAGDADLLTWVLMPDHVHWLIRLKNEPLARVVARMKASVSRDLHHSGEIESPIWARAFHDRAIRHDQDLRAAARYIVANPLRAGLCRALADYPFWNAIWLDGDAANR